ncbi:KRR1 small subunit processome component homolog isoform X2 [Prunus dulcis]|uniref:KRR1 small subunit processome component homolog isoform X2 n=1 Tax=Prunus dulcis TaxID=3755 RepID=UPI0014836DFD|nr:KRR1 small subunit processome component homolog isoform X2 [Prunus dulcis]
MNNKVNGVEDPSVNHMEMDKSGPPASNEDSPIDYSILLMPFRRRSNLQEAWPVLESSLEEYGISCELDMDQFFITFTTTRAKDPYAILNSRYLIRLLAAEVPPRQALKVMYGMPCYLIYTGYHLGGLCSKFGIKTDKYVSRKKLLMTLPIQELEKLTGCSIYLRPNNDMVAAMGPIKGLKLVRSIVEDCIVHNMPPAHRVKRLANYVQAIKGVEALRL